MTQKTTSAYFDQPEAPVVDDVCKWLSTRPSLDQVAEQLLHARLVERDLAQMIELMRQHVMAAIGDGIPKETFQQFDGLPF